MKVKHNPNNIGPTASSNTLGTDIIQPQEQQQQQQQLHQPIVPKNNAIDIRANVLLLPTHLVSFKQNMNGC